MFVFCFKDTPVITFKSIFKGKQDVLEETLDIEHGLLAKLETLEVITSQHRAAIEVHITFLLLIVFKAKPCITILTPH